MSNGPAPEVLEVYVGSFASPSYGLWWDGKQLVYESFVSGYEERVQSVIVPSDAQWSRFWQTMDAINVWSWRERYEKSVPVAGTQIHDRTHWSLTIARGDRRVESSGDDAGPNDAGFNDGAPFTVFAEAVSRLTGGYAFG